MEIEGNIRYVPPFLTVLQVELFRRAALHLFFLAKQAYAFLAGVWCLLFP